MEPTSTLFVRILCCLQFAYLKYSSIIESIVEVIRPIRILVKRLMVKNEVYVDTF
mgnify:CR=1 FL=1